MLKQKDLELLKTRIAESAANQIDAMPDGKQWDKVVDRIEAKSLADMAAIDRIIKLAREYNLLTVDN